MCDKIMGFWKDEFSQIASNKKISPDIIKQFDGVYKNSVAGLNGSIIFIARLNDKIPSPKVLVVIPGNDEEYGFHGKTERIGGCRLLVCDLTHENAVSLRKHFPYTAPVCLKDRKTTIGLGDRLGIATPAHAVLMESYDASAVFAQQSIRELSLCGRTYENVLDDVSFAVFQEGYKKGFGADGDHLKSLDEVKMALDAGYTMITLDCSEHIDDAASALSGDALDARYSELEKSVRDNYDSKYLGARAEGEGFILDIARDNLQRTVVVFGEAINFAEMVFENCLKHKDVVFELSIDETLTSTDPVSHFIIASELLARGVRIDNLAPRFIGEFQKGIDYIGDAAAFTKEFEVHCAIADHLGYKISVHSGSDKFKIFSIVGEKAKGRYHLKTSGTNWLEAVRTIAVTNPSLYRRMHRYAEENIEQAKQYYHISAKRENIPDIDLMDDSDLPSLLDIPDARQYLHITYGLILNAGNRTAFYEDIYQTLGSHEDEYLNAIASHIGRHLDELNIRKLNTGA